MWLCQPFCITEYRVNSAPAAFQRSCAYLCERSVKISVKTGLRSAPKKWCKAFIKRKRWCVEHRSDDASVATMAAEKDILCVLVEECSEPDEISINTCLILQNTLDVTVTAVQNKREHPNRVDLWKLWFISIVIQHLPRISGWKDKHFRWRIIHFLPPRLCYDLYDRIIFIVSIRVIIIADHCCCAMIL